MNNLFATENQRKKRNYEQEIIGMWNGFIPQEEVSIRGLE